MALKWRMDGSIRVVFAKCAGFDRETCAPGILTERVFPGNFSPSVDVYENRGKRDSLRI